MKCPPEALGSPALWPLAVSTVLPTWAWQAGREATPLPLDTRGRSSRPDLLSLSPLPAFVPLHCGSAAQ